MQHFKTIRAISSASVEELTAAVGKTAAQAVYDHFHQENDQ